MSEESVSEVDKGWEGEEGPAEAMGDRLVREALGDTPVSVGPMDDRVMVFPVVPDEQMPVDLTIVQLGGQDLPEIGVVVAVGWKVNAPVIEQLRKIDGRKNPSDLDRAMKAALTETEFLSRGDIVCVNKFSGMDVPGTNFVVLSRQDVLCKLHNFPVRLRVEQDRWDQLDGRQTEHVDQLAADAIQKAPPIISASR